MNGALQGALFGDPAVIDTGEQRQTETQDPREVARIVQTAQEPGFLVIERTGLVLRSDPARPGCADAVSRHDGDTVAQLLDSGHLKLGGTHHTHHHGQEGPARSVLVPKATRDMVTRWDHLRPIPEPTATTPSARTRSSGVIGVDIVERGKALVTCGSADFSGTIIINRPGYGSGASDGRYTVETEHGHFVGNASSYRAGAGLLARHHGYRPGPIEIEHEYRLNRY